MKIYDISQEVSLEAATVFASQRKFGVRNALVTIQCLARLTSKKHN